MVGPGDAIRLIVAKVAHPPPPTPPRTSRTRARDEAPRATTPADQSKRPSTRVGHGPRPRAEEGPREGREGPLQHLGTQGDGTMIETLPGVG
jgi:hypothetical protein